MGSYRVCMCFTRKFRLSEAEPPEDVKAAFNKYGGGGGHLTAEQLQRFLIEEQKEEGVIITHAEAIINQIIQKRHHVTMFARGHTLTLDDFHHYLFSLHLNPTFIPKVHHDMTAPLSRYYIYTGHNSYLTGNQLTSDCSEVPIIKALEKGVRVIELDIWPNSSEDDVLVLHGRTVTAPVELLKCLKAIKEHAFSASPYPVVITLEDHLTSDLQAKVAQMLTETFGDTLFCPESECLKELPSPEDLKYRFLISTKPPKEYLEAETLKDKQNDSQREKDSDDDVWGQEPSKLTADEAEKEENNIDRCERDQDNEDDDESDQKVRPPPAYKRLIAIHAGKPKGGLSEALKVDPEKVRRLSLSEQALEKAAESHGTDIVRFTQRNILRVYPKGTRFNSSNYKPFVGWMHGAQMVAFNMQGYGRSLWLMQGWFRANGGCGYVKKPEFLMNVGPNNEVFDPRIDMPVKMTLKVTVYTGEGWHLDFKQTHFDPYSPPDFYARVGIAGVPADAVMKKTKKKEDTWLPIWNEEFTFPLTIPELAILRIEVHEYDMSEKDEFAGQTCIPVSELRPGIRAVGLHNKKGETYKSVKLLLRFEFL